MQLGRRIKKYIEKKGITLTSVSEKTHISKVVLNESLIGCRELSVEEYARICRALDVKMEYFIEEAIL